MPVVAYTAPSSLRLHFFPKRFQLEQVRNLSNECFQIWLLVPSFREPLYVCAEAQTICIYNAVGKGNLHPHVGKSVCHRLREWVNGGQREAWGEGIVREFGMDMYPVLYLKWITNKDLLYSTWNSAQYYVAAGMGGELGGEWMHVYVWLSPFTVHLKLSQRCW